MVNLSIDPPPFGRTPSSGGSGAGRYLLLLVVVAALFGGGFYAGRYWTLRTHRFASSPSPQPGQPGAPIAAARAPAPAAQAPATPPPAVPGTTAAPALVAAAPGAAVPGAAAPVAAVPAPAAAPASPPAGPLVHRIAITLAGPLEESVAAALAPGERAWAQELTQVMNRLLVWNLQISRDGRKGDRVEVLFELPTAQPSEIAPVGAEGPATKEPVILALRYGSQKLGKLLTAYRYKPEGAPFARYYTADAVEVEEHLVDSPIEGYEQITSLLRDGRRHKGVDFKTPVGTPVKAPFDGTIEKRNWHFGANGNCLELVDGKSGRHAIFLHLEAAPKEMQPGRQVRKGEELARSGNSGHSTAPHLHYQLEAPDGRVLDPFAVLPTKRVALEGVAKTAFEAERNRLDPMLLATAAK